MHESMWRLAFAVSLPENTVKCTKDAGVPAKARYCPKHEETNAEEWEAVLANCLQYDLWGKTARPTRIWLANTFDRIPARPLSLTIAPQSLGGELQREAGILQGLLRMESSHRAILQRCLLPYCSTVKLQT